MHEIHVMNTKFNKTLYVGSLILGLYYLIFKEDYLQAASSMGIGLIFDPFNPEQNWKERPNWQKAILILHLAFVAAMIGLGMGLNDK